MAAPPTSGSALRETVLIADDREQSAGLARQALRRPGRQVLVCATARELLSVLPARVPDLILLSLDLPDLPGIAAIEALRQRAPGVPLIATSRRPSIPLAVQAIRAGAVDFLPQPLQPVELVAAAEAASAAHRPPPPPRVPRDSADMLTSSPRMLRVLDQIRAVAATDATVLVRGETGTGKELVARAIHARSRRRERPLISVNCGAFTETLLESELFGHEKGSFTSAVGRRQGVFEMADGGTLFLDELGETSLNVQVNLLRVLETMSFRRVGGQEEIGVDVRIIAATHVDLERAVAERRFRQDLFYRLNVFPIDLPPLRERREDLPLLMRHFLEQAAAEYGLEEPPAISPEAMEAILRYAWPGNVRQLRSLCERWVIVAGGREITADLLPPELRGAPPPVPAANLALESAFDDGLPMKEATLQATAGVERAYLHRLLQRYGGHLGQTADAAGITRRTLYTKMKAYRLDAEDYRQR